MIRYDNPEEATPGVVQTGVDGKRAIDRGVVGTASGSTFVRRNPPLQWGQKKLRAEVRHAQGWFS